MRTICIGDVHGCLDQLDELLRIVVPAPTDQLVFLGDLMDKGPDPVGVVRRVRELGALCVMGNHDEKHVRWRRHETARAATGKANPMRRFDPVTEAQNAALSDDDVAWLQALPTILRIDADCIALHGGLEPRFTIDKQDPQKVMRCRYVDVDGKMAPIMNDVDQPEGTVRWATACREPVHIFYGHHCVNFANPSVDIYDADDDRRWLRVGVDGACAYGGALIAAISTAESRELGNLDFVHVEGKKYAELWQE